MAEHFESFLDQELALIKTPTGRVQHLRHVLVRRTQRLNSLLAKLPENLRQETLARFYRTVCAELTRTESFLFAVHMAGDIAGNLSRGFR
jgi:hypothetical protein